MESRGGLVSSQEHEPGQQGESKSSIKISRNAKGEAQFEIKAYEDVLVDEMTRLREIAVSNYKALNSEFYGAAA